MGHLCLPGKSSNFLIKQYRFFYEQKSMDFEFEGWIETRQN